MKTLRILPVLVLAAVVACKRGIPEDQVAARVNGAVLTKTEYEEQVQRQLQRYKGQGHQLQPNIETRVRESVLRRMIDDKMIELKAAELKIDIKPEELEAKFTEHKARFRTDQAFQDYLKRSQNNEANMKDDLKRNLLRDQVVEKLSGAVDVTEDEAKKYYEENKARFTEREQVKASRILIRVMPNATDAEKKKAKQKAMQLATQVKKPTADFAKLARENSNGPEAARDGDLAWLNRGRMPEEFDRIVFAMKANDVSPAFETRAGWEIVKVWERKDERIRPLEEVQENIKTSLLARKKNDKRRDVLRQLKEGAKVEQLIEFPKTEGMMPPGAPMALPGSRPGAEGRPEMPNLPSSVPPRPGLPTGMPEQAPGAAPQPAPAPAAAPN